MNVFVLWGSVGPGPARMSEGDVAQRLARVFGELFAVAPKVSARSFGSAQYAALDLPVQGLRIPSAGEDQYTWASAAQFPVNVAQVVDDIAATGDAIPALCRMIEAKGAEVLARLAPPFALIWHAKDRDEVCVQTDGLGQAPLYEYSDGESWAITNRPFALAALGVELVPRATDWAVRAGLGWFPGDLTGFERLRYVAPGTRICLNRGGLVYKKNDVLGGWLHQPPMDEQEALERCARTLRQFARAAARVSELPTVSLSGGWDSRAVTALFLAEGVPLRAKVRGPADHPDVVVASRLAEVAGFEIGTSHIAGLPPEDPEQARENSLRALLWQAGGRNAHMHKSFESGFTDGGEVGITGQHGEIGRSYYLGTTRKKGLPADGSTDVLLGYLLKRMPPYLSAEMRAHVSSVVRQAIDAADSYGLKGIQRWEFFYLFERTRRWAAAAQSGKPGVKIAPFSSTEFIEAVYALPDVDKTTNPIHRHIVATLMPAWVGVSYASELVTQMPKRKEDGGWKQAGRRRFYDTKLYWQEIGRDLITQELEREGFWQEVFDSEQAKQRWADEPDELMVVCLLPEALRIARDRASGSRCGSS